MDLHSFKREARELLQGRDEVLLAYLYGSAAKGEMREKSDLDLGLVVKDTSQLEDNHYEAKLARQLQAKTEVKRELDVRLLNDRDSTFLHQVLKYGECVFSRDETTRVEFETRALELYADLEPKRKEYNKERARRLQVDG